MVNEIRWDDKEAMAGGRNGWCKCSGVGFYFGNGQLRIEPLRSNGQVVSGAGIDIPQDKLLDLAIFLWEFNKG